MDLASSFVLVGAAHIAAKQNYIKYPAGKSKYETAGIIVFATLMCTLSLEIVVTSIQGITAADHDLSFSFVSIICVGVALGTKLLLFLYCRLLTQFPTAKILAQDHRNDLLLNSTGILFGLLADYFAWWIDPFGAILIAILILWSWSMTGKGCLPN
jgi:divalent metal cation (Fe/Co/Zn/Cd) transporter